MNATETVLILLLAICVVACVAQRMRLAYPIAFVLAGIGMAMLPGFPAFEIPPEAILLLFLPPLLTEAAYFTSLRDFKANLRPILQLAIGLVVATCAGTAFALAQVAPEIGLAVAFVLGAIISPPDAVAAIAITQRIPLPKRVQTILEGESLINDATGLVLYQFAVAAVVTGSFSGAQASMQFLWMMTSGCLLGWIIGWTYMRLFPRIKEMSVEILSTFLVPYLAYILAESIHSSGVLAVVASGLTVGWHAPIQFTPIFRIPALAVWRMVTFVLNGLVFLLIGLHIPGLIERLHDYAPPHLLVLAVAVSAAAIAVRLVWVYAVAYGTRFFFPGLRKRDPYPNWQNVFIVAWTGMRGVVSLALALALPLTVADGSPFPYRDLLIFLALSVIFATLVLQGLALPWIVRKLTLFYEFDILYEQWHAKKDAVESALERLEELRQNPTFQSAAFERIISHYKDRLSSLGDGPNTPLSRNEPPTADSHPLIQTENRIWQEALEAERKAVICLRQKFHISDSVMHESLHDIDLLHNRFAGDDRSQAA